MAKYPNALSRLRTSKGWTQEQAADRAGLSLGGYRKLEYGERQLKVAQLRKFSELFEVSEQAIIDGTATPERARTIPVKGRVGAGAQVEAVDNGDMDEVEAPADANPRTVAVIVEGESGFPAYEPGTLIFYSKHLPPSEMVNRRAVVQLADGRIFLKILRAGSKPGHWTLQSVNQLYPDMVDELVDWAAPIEWIKPRY